MIRINDGSLEFRAALDELCSNSPFGARIYSYVTAFDNKYSFIDSWICTNNNKYICAVCRYYDTVIICGEVNDEIACFTEMLSPGELIYDGKYGLPIDMIWSQGDVMKCTEIQLTVDNDKFNVIKSDGSLTELRSVYNLMANGFDFDNRSGFEDFALDISHRIRHRTADIYTIRNKNEIISSLIVSANSPSCAVLSGVVTRKESRKRGIGSFLVSYVTNELISQNKTIYLQIDKKIALYEKIGFYVCGSWREGRANICNRRVNNAV